MLRRRRENTETQAEIMLWAEVLDSFGDYAYKQKPYGVKVNKVYGRVELVFRRAKGYDHSVVGTPQFEFRLTDTEKLRNLAKAILAATEE